MQPFPSKRAPAFADIPDDKWSDWRWQLSHRLNSIEDFEQILTLTDSEQLALVQVGLLRVDIMPSFASLIDPENPLDPI
ncbi:MAG: lysine 2,3-aminomutase, partial [Anaerolineaceae bacterium]